MKQFISSNMAENPKFNELLAKIDSLPAEYIEELYSEFEVIEPLKTLGMKVIMEEATKKLRSMVESSLRYHE